MIRRFKQLFLLLGVIACFSTIARGDIYDVGLFTYDQISPTQTEFDITNGTGTNAPLLGFPITTPVTFNISSLVVNFLGGGSTILPGGDFTVVDGQDDLDCIAGSPAACNFSGSLITSAVLTGTFSPTTGLSGLTPPDTGILPGFSTLLTPSSGPVLIAGIDGTVITATGVSSTGTVPEPEAVWLLATTIVGIFLIGRRSRRLRRDDGASE